MGNDSFLSLGEQRWILPSGRPSLTIGRDPAADIHLDANELASRLHARLWLSAAGWSISDDGSRNGTRLNGLPVTVAVPLHDNDRIQIGDAVLTFHGPGAAGLPAEAQPARPSGSRGSRVRLMKIMTVAAVVEGVGLAANGIAAFVADHVGGIARWLAAPAIALIAAMVTAVVEAVSKEPATSTASSTSTTAAPGRRRGTPAAVAIIVVLAVVGVGGFAVAAGFQYAAGYLTGKESGDDRLVRSDAFRSQWPDTVPPGAFQRGTITFKGHLPDNLTTASLSFSQVFGPGGKSLTIAGIKLEPA